MTLPVTLHKYTTKQNLPLQKQKTCEIQQWQLHEQQQQQSQPHQATPPEWYFYQHQKHHPLPSQQQAPQLHEEGHIQQQHHKRNNRIFHKTHHLSNSKFQHLQMKEMKLCGMISLNFDEDFNIELCSSTPSKKVVETKGKHFSWW